MFDFYFTTIFFAVMIMIFLIIMAHYNPLLEETACKKLTMIASLVIIASISEWFGVILDQAPAVTRCFHILVKFLELSLAPCIPILCSELIGRPHTQKLIRALLLFHTGLELISCFNGMIFYVDPSNVYHHGPFYNIYIVAFSFGILLFIWMIIRESMQQYGVNRVILFFLPIFTLCGLGFQYLAVSPIRIIWLCTSIDVLLMYILYIERTQNVDAVTHLLNRRYYEGRIARLNSPAVIFYFDVNDFKHINDTYGHDYGDFSLSNVGACIQMVFEKIGYCYRIGGDEFCSITSISISKADFYVNLFYDAIRFQRQKDSRFPAVSVGYAFFDPAKDNIADVIKKADTMMYLEKQCLKSGKSH